MASAEPMLPATLRYASADAAAAATRLKAMLTLRYAADVEYDCYADAADAIIDDNATAATPPPRAADSHRQQPLPIVVDATPE